MRVRLAALLPAASPGIYTDPVQRPASGAETRPVSLPERQRRLVAIALLLALSGAAAARAAAPAPAAPPAPTQPAFFHDLALDLRAATRLPWEMSYRRRTNLGLGLLAIAATAPFDVRIREAYRRTATSANEQFARNVRPLGQAGGIALIGLGWGIGRLSHNAGLVATANDSLEATLLAAGIVAPVLKEVVGRARPPAERGSHRFTPFSGDTSFPSGEAAEVFAIAAVVSAHHPALWARVAAWGTAAVLANGRLRLDGHWASDIVAGGLLGSAVGTWVVHEHRRRATMDAHGGPAAQSRFQWVLSPSLSASSRTGRRHTGLTLDVTW